MRERLGGVGVGGAAWLFFLATSTGCSLLSLDILQSGEGGGGAGPTTSSAGGGESTTTSAGGNGTGGSGVGGGGGGTGGEVGWITGQQEPGGSQKRIASW